MPFYAVAKGKETGIYSTWDDCQLQVKGFSGAIYKKFKTKAEAEEFIEKKSEPVKKKRKIEYTEEDEIRDILKFVETCEDEEIPTSSTNKSTNKDYSKPKIKSELPGETTLKKYGKYIFNEDANGFVHVFTDGSCESNGSKFARAGLGVYFGKNHPLNASEPVKGKATNNVGEIQASIKAIESAQSCEIRKLNIFTDSQYLMNSICIWMPKWKKNKWMLANQKEVKNKIDFQRLDQLINSGNMLIKWSYIPAHKGHDGNEAADRLAKEGAQRYKF
ncbi:hypothetical protein PVAND_000818 [Polypedilum vanderplanki]|uniref:Ribonuclease H1 n=1 Tax=Polypedilum vanderplanki TaxID=319348 RepID=A0A9J6BL28_POLVA|nr:hypothetical protein PVAND_000818 [Polypedilum vanderplanki]